MKHNPNAGCARKPATPAERALWDALRSQPLAGYTFVRHQPIGPYTADFACHSHRLAIDVDANPDASSGPSQRDAYLLQQGFSLLRLPPATVMNDRTAACEAILAALERRLERRLEEFDLRYNEL